MKQSDQAVRRRILADIGGDNVSTQLNQIDRLGFVCASIRFWIGFPRVVWAIADKCYLAVSALAKVLE